ncbi:MAG: helix-turn-helix transcriptional regulator [Clostridia bacterium]|nr:helix-turn-helix transcriptional regulator [Clostridia bacterium]
MSTNETLGTRIARLRREKNMTQDEVAEKMNLSPQAVSKWENDQSCPDIMLLPQLADLFGVTTDTLLKGETNEPAVRILPPEERKNFDQMMLRVNVNSADGDIVHVNLPMPLIKMALDIGMEIPKVNDKLGVNLKDIDMNKIIALVEQGVIGRLVEVQSANGDLVEVVVE